jgi:4-hydroxy-tetrahydrodipicolinate synthase
MRLNGALTALITPFQSGEVDYDALETFVKRQIDGGIDGLVPCGTTGEAATLDREEKYNVIETVADMANADMPVVAGTGTNDTKKSIKLTKDAAEIDGVDAALVVTPYYNKTTQEGLYHHFTEVAEKGGLPVVLYNVPSRTGISLEVDTIEELAKHDDIIAIKEATGDIEFVSNVIEAVRDRDDFSVLSGDDFSTYPLAALGGDGCVSVASNIRPGRVSKMIQHARGGRIESATDIHYELQPLFRTLFGKTNPVPVKVMAWSLGLCEPEIRGPLHWPEASFIDEVRSFVKTHPELELNREI